MTRHAVSCVILTAMLAVACGRPDQHDAAAKHHAAASDDDVVRIGSGLSAAGRHWSRRDADRQQHARLHLERGAHRNRLFHSDWHLVGQRRHDLHQHDADDVQLDGAEREQLDLVLRAHTCTEFLRPGKPVE
jgi:hypothetical protein